VGECKYITAGQQVKRGEKRNPRGRKRAKPMSGKKHTRSEPHGWEKICINCGTVSGGAFVPKTRAVRIRRRKEVNRSSQSEGDERGKPRRWKSGKHLHIQYRVTGGRDEIVVENRMDRVLATAVGSVQPKVLRKYFKHTISTY